MKQIIHLYIDDSGTRHPDHRQGRIAGHGHDYFALGGILIKESDEPAARKLHSNFCGKWEIKHPLHSVEIRGKNKNFAWIGKLSETEQENFYEDLYQVLAQAPVLGIACVIDRPGYNHRYQAKYDNDRWSLCKTTFAILVERAAKYADKQGCKLRVFPEKCSKKEDRILKGYFNHLKTNGMPFNSKNSSTYAPLNADDFRRLLYDFKVKEKTSPMVQLADLYLWPMAMGGYKRENIPYQKLLKDKKLIDCLYDAAEVPHLGIKYSCFDLVHAAAVQAS